MKAGVWIWPCGVEIVPTRAKEFSSAFLISKEKLKASPLNKVVESSTVSVDSPTCQAKTLPHLAGSMLAK